MLLKSVSAVNSRGHVLNLPLDGSIDDGFAIRDIQGLGPVKAEVVSSRFAALDGEQYHSSSRVKRNIIFNLGLHPDYGQQSVYDLRNQLYAYFMPKTAIKLKFESYDKFVEETLNVEIDGIVEYAEPSIFSKDPSIDISVLCHQPDFIDPTIITVNGVTVSELTYTDIDYKGTVDTGFLFTFFISKALDLGAYGESFELGQTRPDGLQEFIRYNEALNIDDILKINTVPGDKYIQYFAGGVGLGSSRMYAFGDFSSWLQLRPGLNRFIISTNESKKDIPYTIEYVNRYGGI